METLTLMGEREKAFDILKDISRQLSDENYWLSTQETAFALKAVSSFAGIDKHGDLKFSYVLNGKTVDVSSQKPVTQIQIPITGVKKELVKITNESEGTLFARVIMTGTPARGDEEDESKGITLQVTYTDPDGAAIDISKLKQGTEFMAHVSVHHDGVRNYYENLALSQVFPSGWEINNLRLNGDEEFAKNSPFSYQDIRDDRVYTYLNLYAGETRRYTVLLTASYAGKYYLPATTCEAMYDHSIYGRKKGMVVEVVKPIDQ
jgi:uncharacterized protein YfaS (alpha-2-macroglobulin family)